MEPDDEGKQLPIIREVPPPCRDCPKGGPENEHELVLSDRNYAAWLMYEKLQATSGAYRIPEHLSRCELFAHNMFLVRRSLEAGRAKAQADAYKKSRDESDL